MARQYSEKMPHMQFAVFEKKKTKQWVIDYIMYPKGTKIGFVEWNYFEAGKVKGMKGIVVNQFVTRKYSDISLAEVFKSWDIGAYRRQMLSVLMPSEFDIVED